VLGQLSEPKHNRASASLAEFRQKDVPRLFQALRMDNLDYKITLHTLYDHCFAYSSSISVAYHFQLA
jgi:hypothetical protein